MAVTIIWNTEGVAKWHCLLVEQNSEGSICCHFSLLLASPQLCMSHSCNNSRAAKGYKEGTKLWFFILPNLLCITVCPPFRKHLSVAIEGFFFIIIQAHPLSLSLSLRSEWALCSPWYWTLLALGSSSACSSCKHYQWCWAFTTPVANLHFARVVPLPRLQLQNHVNFIRNYNVIHLIDWVHISIIKRGQSYSFILKSLNIWSVFQNVIVLYLLALLFFPLYISFARAGAAWEVTMVHCIPCIVIISSILIIAGWYALVFLRLTCPCFL